MSEKPTHEDQLVAAISHASILVPMFGAAIALVIYLGRGRQSRFVRLHSLQGLAVDMASIALIVLAYILYFVTMFILMIPLMLIPIFVSGSSSSEGSIIAGIIAVLVILLFCLALGVYTFIFNFVVPVMGIVALVAAGVTLSGRNFRYPILAHLLERKQTQAVAVSG